MGFLKENCNASKICNDCGGKFLGHRNSKYCNKCKTKERYYKKRVCSICKQEIKFGGSKRCEKCNRLSSAKFLEDKKIKPIGSDKQIEVELRIISASNKPFKNISKGKTGRFRCW